MFGRSLVTKSSGSHRPRITKCHMDIQPHWIWITSGRKLSRSSCRKYHLWRLRVELLENGLSKYHEILHTHRGQSVLPASWISKFASVLSLTRFRKLMPFNIVFVCFFPTSYCHHSGLRAVITCRHHHRFIWSLLRHSTVRILNHLTFFRRTTDEKE